MDTKKYNLLPCPFCGGAVSKCDESPLYGGSIMHDETECLFKNNLLFHGNIAERWNSRPIEDALQARIAELEKAIDGLTLFILGLDECDIYDQNNLQRELDDYFAMNRPAPPEEEK